MAAKSSDAFLLVLGEREGIWWVLTEQRMAFEAHRAGLARRLAPGTGLLLYATRGAFHNPTRDRGRVIGAAIVTSSIEALERPVVIAGREFTVGCELEIRALAPRGGGVELAPLVDDLRAFPAKHAWSARLRQPLVALPDEDAALLLARLRDAVPAGGSREAIETYRWPREAASAT